MFDIVQQVFPFLLDSLQAGSLLLQPAPVGKHAAVLVVNLPLFKADSFFFDTQGVNQLLVGFNYFSQVIGLGDEIAERSGTHHHVQQGNIVMKVYVTQPLLQKSLSLVVLFLQLGQVFSHMADFHPGYLDVGIEIIDIPFQGVNLGTGTTQLPGEILLLDIGEMNFFSDRPEFAPNPVKLSSLGRDGLGPGYGTGQENYRKQTQNKSPGQKSL